MDSMKNKACSVKISKWGGGLFILKTSRYNKYILILNI